MRKQAILSLVLGTIALALVILVVVAGTANFDQNITKTMEAILTGSSEKVGSGLVKPRERLFRLGDSLTARDGVGQDLRSLISGAPPSAESAEDPLGAADVADPGAKAPAAGAGGPGKGRRAKSKATGVAGRGGDSAGQVLFVRKLSPEERLKKIRKKFEKEMQNIRSRGESLSGVMLVDERGAVVLSDSEAYPVGEKAPFKSSGILKEALAGREAYGAFIAADGKILGVSVAPVQDRGTAVAGVLVLVEPVVFTWEDTEINLFFVKGGEVVAGEAVGSMALPKEFKPISFGLASFAPKSDIVGVGPANLKPLFIPPENFKVRAREVVVPGNAGLRGFVRMSPALEYAELGGIQYTIILLTMGLWLLGIMLTVAFSKRYLESGDKIADIIGARFQGTIPENVDDSEFPEEFVRLNKLVGQLVEEVDTKGINVAEAAFGEAGGGLEFLNEESLAAFASSNFFSGGQEVNLGELTFAPKAGTAEFVKAGSLFREGPGGTLTLGNDDDDFSYPDEQEKGESPLMPLMPLIPPERPKSPAASASPEPSASPKSPAPPPVSSPPVMSAKSSSSEGFSEIYDRYIDVRKSCGQSTEVASEAFMERLKETEEAVKAQHKCAVVDFEVYVKDGKAALRASPGGP